MKKWGCIQEEKDNLLKFLSNINNFEVDSVNFVVNIMLEVRNSIFSISCALKGGGGERNPPSRYLLIGEKVGFMKIWLSQNGRLSKWEREREKNN